MVESVRRMDSMNFASSPNDMSSCSQSDLFYLTLCKEPGHLKPKYSSNS